MIKSLVAILIKIYRATRPFRLPACRFYPSCSDYLSGCVEVHGLGHGLSLALLRLLRCHPWHPGGIDEVPAVPEGL